MRNIYVVEDDESIRELIRCTLKAFNYSSKCFEAAEDMLAACAVELPGLVLLDIMLPGIDGIQALEKLKADPTTEDIPVIMLTARASEADRVKGLDLGADDYISKPFGILELTARIRAVMRRADKAAYGHNIINHGDIIVDTDKRTVSLNDKYLELTLKEYELLLMLLQNSGKVMTREELLEKVWGYDYQGETRTLDMHIKTLRKKLGDSADSPKYIKTVRGVGYTIL